MNIYLNDRFTLFRRRNNVSVTEIEFLWFLVLIWNKGEK